MNSMGRRLVEGEVVVLHPDVFNDEYKALKWRLVYVRGGFGMSPITTGSALICEHVEDGEVVRYSGGDIDRLATNEYQAHQKRKGLGGE